MSPPKSWIMTIALVTTNMYISYIISVARDMLIINNAPQFAYSSYHVIHYGHLTY